MFVSFAFRRPAEILIQMNFTSKPANPRARVPSTAAINNVSGRFFALSPRFEAKWWVRWAAVTRPISGVGGGLRGSEIPSRAVV
jgi:hypothetical protein